MSGPWEQYRKPGPWAEYASAEKVGAGGTAKPVKIGKDAFPDALRQTLQETDWGTRNIAGAGTALANLYEGGKQMVGMGDPAAIEAQRIIAEEAPVGALAGNVALLAPTMAIPGANTVAGAGVTGAITGLMQPTMGDESRLLNTALGAAGGAAGQAAGNKIGTALQTRLANKTAEAAGAKSRNAVRDATLAEARAAGYVVPNSEVAPSFIGNRLESLAGKTATKQEATLRNQQTTNTLASKALGLPKDEAITQNAIDAVRKRSSAVYEEVGNLSQQARADLEALKQARADATGWFNAYNRSASPDDLLKAKQFRATADQLEQALEAEATGAGRPDLPAALAQARKEIAKSYTVQRALNPATGDVSAPVLGRLYAKQKPLSDGLDTIGKFQAGFPKFAGDGAKTPAPGVSKVEAAMAALLGGGAAGLTGNPIGLAAAALPFASHPARALALAKALQTAPSYSPGIGTRAAAAALPPDRAALIARALAQTGTPGAVAWPAAMPAEQ